MKRIALAFGLLLIGVATAQAFDKNDPAAFDKTWQLTEPYWNPVPANVILSDVAEVEPNNPRNLAQPLGCGNTLRPAAVSAPADTDYVAFTATAGTIVTIGTNADGTTGQLTDTRIRLFNSAGTVLASDDDSGPGLYSLITYTVTATGSYTVGLAAFSATATGIYQAFITCQAAQPPPENDTCAGALPLPCGNISLSGSTAFATHDYTPLASGTGGCTGFTALGRDVVYSRNAVAGDILNISYTSSADGSVYIVTDCTNPSGTCVAGKDATVSGQAETLSYTFPTTGLYYLILDSFGANTSGTWTLTGTLDCGTVGVEQRQWTFMKSLYR